MVSPIPHPRPDTHSEPLVVIPAAGKLRHIDPGSGIVATPTDHDQWRIDYEGNRYNSANLVTFADRVHIAWSRQKHNYPTIARAITQPDDIVVVATFNPTTGIVTPTNATTAALLTTWIGSPLSEPVNEMETTGSHHETLRAVLELPEQKRIALLHTPGLPDSVQRVIADLHTQQPSQ